METGGEEAKCGGLSGAEEGVRDGPQGRARLSRVVTIQRKVQRIEAAVFG